MRTHPVLVSLMMMSAIPPAPDGETQVHRRIGRRRTVVVGPVGTSPENGAALLAAMARITNATATNPWLLKIEPGVYDLGATSFNFKPYVDVEGSGELTTTIRSNAPHGTVVAAGPAELRLVTVENTGGNEHSFALHAYSPCSDVRFAQTTFRASNGTAMTRPVEIGTCVRATFKHVTAIAFGGATTFSMSPGIDPLIENAELFASGATDYNQGLYLPSGGTVRETYVRLEGKGLEGVVVGGGSPYLNGLRVEAITQAGSGGQALRVSATSGIGPPLTTIENSSLMVTGPGGHSGVTTYLDGGMTAIRRTTIVARTGISMSSGTGTFNVDASTIVGAANTISLSEGGVARVGASQLSGGPALGNVTCVGVYDENYASAGYTACP